jgi:hypothetical protein
MILQFLAALSLGQDCTEIIKFKSFFSLSAAAMLQKFHSSCTVDMLVRYSGG